MSLKPLSHSEKFRQYIEENSVEKAAGYLEAVRDITALIDSTFSEKIGSQYFKASPSKTISALKKIFEENSDFLEQAEKVMSEIPLKKTPG